MKHHMKHVPIFVMMTALGATTMAAAQEAGEAKGTTGAVSTLEEIVVTAQRREENLQVVPLAVTALSAETLANFRVTGMHDLSGLSPNLHIGHQGLQSTPTISLRGITSGTSQNTVDPKVGLYLDGVYIGRSVGAIFDLADIERVEVLRGPQGTLFGRNATGGAISLVTAAPAGEFGFRQDISLGNNAARRARTVIDFPALGSLAMKFSYLHDEDDGTARNLIAGNRIDLRARDPRLGQLRYAKRLGSKDVDAYQFAARFDAADSLVFDYRFDYTDSETTSNPMQILGVVGDTAALVQGIFAFQPYFGGQTNQSLKRLDRVANASSVESLTIQGHNLTVSWDAAPGLNLKSITAYREMEQDPTIQDLAASGGLRFTVQQLGALLSGDPASIAAIPTMPVGPNDSFFTLLTARETSQRQFTQELQLTLTRDAFDLVAGAFYFDEHSPALSALGIFQPVANGVVIPTPLDGVFGSGVNESIADNRSLAVYSQGTWHVNERFDITLGARHTRDKRETDLIQAGAAGAGGLLQPGVYKKDFSNTSYAFNLAYHLSEATMAYARIASGYVSGGQLDAIPYGPEKLINYEVGLKSQLFENRLRLNAAAFYMDYKDLQIQSFQNGVLRFDNAGRAKIHGLEIEVDAVPFDGLSVGGSFGYQKVEYKKFVTAGVDIADIAQQQYTPKYDARLYGQYDFAPFASGSHAYLRLDLVGQSKAALGILQSGVREVDRVAFEKAHTLVDLRLGLKQVPAGGFRLDTSLWAHNLLDEDDVLVFSPTAINRAGSYLPGRTYGIDFTARW